MKFVAAALAVSLLTLPVAGKSQTPIKGILAAQRFTLAEPYEDAWDGTKVSAGTLLVLDVDPALVKPRESLNSILYVGGKPTRKLNRGDVSGHVLVIVPAGVDVVRAQIWLGAPEVLEALTSEKIDAEKLRAARHVPRAPAPPQRAPVQSKDLAALLRDVAAPLIDEFSPQDAPVAAQWRLPESH